MHRAKDLLGNEVKGSHCKVRGKHYIIPEDADIAYSHRVKCIMGFTEIDPTTLAMDTTVPDKDDTPIYSSFEYEPGRMSEGGDRVTVCKPEMRADSGCVYYDSKEAMFMVASDKLYQGKYELRNLYDEKIIGHACDLGDKKC